MASLRNVDRQADYDGGAPNVAPKAAKEAEPPVFAGFKLKSVARPADYDGKEPNVATKKGDQPVQEGAANDSSKLKKVGNIQAQ